MSNRKDSPYARLERIFHEPGRLAIMSALLGTAKGATFTELKKAGNFTDGNLSRHLKSLEEVGAVTIKKRFAKNRPQTTICLSTRGRKDFLSYLQALEGCFWTPQAKSAPTRRNSQSIPLQSAFN